MTTTTNISGRINSYNSTWMMTDNQTKWEKSLREETQLKADCNELTNEELREVYANLNERGLNNLFGEAIKARLESLPPEPKAQSIQTKVMTNAWALIKSNVATNLSEALKMSWKRFKTIEALKSGIAYLTFTKSDGSTRIAIATLRNGNYSYQSNNSTKKKNPATITFWDLEKKAFRACKIDRLVEVAA